MGDGHAEVCGQLLSGRMAVAHSNIFTGAHQDDTLSGGKYRHNHLLARVVIGEGDRSAALVVAVAKDLHMLVPGPQELRDLALAPLGMVRRGRVPNIAD